MQRYTADSVSRLSMPRVVPTGVWSWDPSGELASRISEMIDEHAEKLRPGSIGTMEQHYEQA